VKESESEVLKIKESELLCTDSTALFERVSIALAFFNELENNEGVPYVKIRETLSFTG
jgi:hypothetical protein